MRIWIALPLAVGLLAGCGGGGGSSPTPPANGRANKVGDSWEYSVDIDFGFFGQYQGTLSEDLSSDTYKGNPTTKFTRTFNLNLQQGPAVLSSAQQISSNGKLVAETVNGDFVDVVSNTFVPPPAFVKGAQSSGVLTLANGQTFTETYKVVGASSVVTAAGKFNCWLIDEEVDHSDGITDTSEFWIAPEIGNYVRLVNTTINPDGTGYRYIASMTSNVTAAIARSSGGVPFISQRPEWTMPKFK